MRIAALFELIEDPNATTIGDAAVTRAVALYQWLRLEARKALGIASGDELAPEMERTALAWIAKQRTRGSYPYVTARELMRGPGRFRSPNMRREEVEAVLTRLEHAGWLTHCAEPPLSSMSTLRTDAQTWWEIRRDFDQVWRP